MKPKYTYTPHEAWKDSSATPIPKDLNKQVQLLERAIYELVEHLVDVKGHDNPYGILDTLSDQLINIASRAYIRAVNDN